VTSAEDIAEVGKVFFYSLFKDLIGCLVSKIIKVINLFHKSMLDDMNELLQEKITEKENISTLSSFQK
jgi:hypothetical protein